MFCKTCDKGILITKHYPGRDLGELWKPERIIPWIEEHLRHHPDRYHMHLRGNPGIDFTTDDYWNPGSYRRESFTRFLAAWKEGEL
jgi:hypothetical protein